MQTKYLVQIEFRYSDWDKEEERSKQLSKTVTIGIYDTYEEACKKGNSMLETELESKFSLNPNWKKKKRFGETYTGYLISDLAYLETPFSFCAQIVPLEISSVSNMLDKVMESERRYKEGKK